MNTLRAEIKETISLWQQLKYEKRPVVIYGMGNGAEKILEACKSYDISIAEVFASDEYVRGHSFQGYTVKKLIEVEEKYEDFVILMAFAVHTEELIAFISDLARRHTLYAPDLPVCGSEPFTYEYFSENYALFQQAYDLLEDDTSRRIYANMLNFKISGKLEYLAEYSHPEKDLIDILELTAQENYLDLGAYDGDTIRQLQKVAGGFQKAVALEPDRKNYKKLLKFIDTCGVPNIYSYNKGSYSRNGELSFDVSGSRNSSIKEGTKHSVEVVACDSIAECCDISYIKMDVEGAEEETLLGCREIIARNKPKLNVSAYHRNDDLYRLPLLIHELCPDYKLYLRKHRYIPAWEIIFYGKI